ncbi:MULTISPECIES: Holliday junction branch migration protein RuvA [Bacillaceae]|uniref:Holliday junction branch migration complex subunit RuvA n=1 Tax=Evansella alkalicola TaxID=745819 RepID=A0ABS6JQ57_9BACI|nr:Holliday junction branch migration protein RuvA [Litchfieldia alkalitelluris]MBU9720701.1 Holliday junction branch migration protein RuvA [Bacillus alkalicola]
MIECLTGKVIHIEVDSIVIDVRDVGYLVYCPNPYRFQDNLNEIITIYIHHHVREDAIKLFGFSTRNEKYLFEKLLQVSGIGPKGALAILATGEPNMVISAIENEDETFLVKFPGVGKKTARQIILDLKGKLENLNNNLGQGQSQNGATIPKVELGGNKELEEALEALKALGYVDREIKKIAPQLQGEQLTTDAFIKKALQLMLN